MLKIVLNHNLSRFKIKFCKVFKKCSHNYTIFSRLKFFNRFFYALCFKLLYSESFSEHSDVDPFILVWLYVLTITYTVMAVLPLFNLLTTAYIIPIDPNVCMINLSFNTVCVLLNQQKNYWSFFFWFVSYWFDWYSYQLTVVLLWKVVVQSTSYWVEYLKFYIKRLKKI